MKSKADKYLTLFADCIPVKGAKEAILMDLGKHRYYTIPTSYVDLLTMMGQHKMRDWGAIYQDEAQEIDQFIAFLINNDLAHFVTDPALFPTIAQDFNVPFLFQNCIIELAGYSSDDEESFGELLSNTMFLEIRDYHGGQLNRLESLIKLVQRTSVRGISVFIRYQSEADITSCQALLNTVPRIVDMVLHSAPETREASNGRLHITTQQIDSAQCCGNISQRYFVAELYTYLEGLQFNTCLNQKISVDHAGQVKNCPSMAHSFGHISDVNLQQLLDNPSFTQYWHISKDQIHKCKDCQFRFVCTDCRAYVDEPGDLYSAPLKCGYDPYEGAWAEWSEHPMKQEAILTYGMRAKAVKNEVA